MHLTTDCQAKSAFKASDFSGGCKGTIHLFLYLILLLSSACTDSRQYDYYTIELEELKAEALLIDSIFNVEKIIRLQSSEASSINQISKVSFSEDRIVIADKFGNSVLLFDGDGSFLGRISGKGRGPGEYLRLSDVYVDFDNDRIYIMDGCEAQKVLVYSLDGAFISETSFEFCANSFTKLDGQYFAFFLTVDRYKENCESFPTLLITDALFQEQWSGIHFSKKWSGYGYHTTFYETVFSNTNTTNYFVPSLPSGVNTIYKVSPSSAAPLVEINPKSNQKVKGLFESGVPNEGAIFDRLNQLDSYHSLNSFFHSKNYLGFSIKKGRINSFIVHKMGRDSYMFLHEFEEDERHGFFSPLPSNDGLLINVVDAHSIESNDFSIFASIKSQVKPEDNPILVVYRLK